MALIFDDHALFKESFSALVERLNVFRSVQAMEREEDLIAFLMKNSHQPVYLFIDYYLGDKVSLALINDAKRLNKQIKVIIVSSVANARLIQNILTYHPHGFLSKSSGLDILVDCIGSLQRNEQFICPFIKEILDHAVVDDLVNFTARELDILQYFARGNSIESTAAQTNLSKHTIVAHRRNMMAKAKCTSITELLAYSRKMGLI